MKNIPAQEYVGCYNDESTRDLPFAIRPPISDLTWEKCASACGQKVRTVLHCSLMVFVFKSMY